MEVFKQVSAVYHLVCSADVELVELSDEGHHPDAVASLVIGSPRTELVRDLPYAALHAELRWLLYGPSF